MNFIWNCEQETIHKHILRAFDDADEIWIAVAFLKTSGLELIYDAIEKVVLRGGKIRIIAGTDFYLTEPEAVGILSDLFEGHDNATISFAISKNNISFHPKIYCFLNRNRATVITGSSNLTSGGLKNNTEICSIVTLNVLDQPFTSVRNYFEYIQRPEMSRKVTPMILETYATYYRKYQKQVKASNEAFKKTLKKDIQKVPKLDEATLKKYFEIYKKEKDINKTIVKRHIAYGHARRILDDLYNNTPRSSADFLAQYEKLVDPQGYWWSGSIFRHKNKVARNYKEFCKMIREIKLGADKEPEELFAVCVEYKKKIDGLGFNVITEIMNTYRPHDCPILNNSPIKSLSHFGISDFPHVNSFKPAHYRRLKQVLEYIKHASGLGSLGMVDNFLNFVYWKLKEES